MFWTFPADKSPSPLRNRLFIEQLDPRLLLAATLPSTIIYQAGYSDSIQTDYTPAVMQNFTVIGGNSSNASLINSLRANGKLFLYNVAYYSNLTVDQLVTNWSAPFQYTFGGQLPGGFDGIEIDEMLSWENGSSDSIKFIAALAQLRSLYPDKVIAPFVATTPSSQYSNLWNAINTHADLVLFEAYQREGSPNLSSLGTSASRINTVAPGLLKKTVFALFSAQAANPGDNSTNVGFHGFLEEQVRTIRNHTLASQMPGVGSYVYSQRATTEYFGRMADHYYVLGNTQPFGDGDSSQDIGNPSFEAADSSWIFTAGAGGSAARVSYTGSGLPQTHDLYGHSSHGNFALRTIRGSAPNQVSYPLIVNPGRSHTVSAFVTATSGNAFAAKLKITTGTGALIAERRVSDLYQGGNIEPWKRIHFTFQVPVGENQIKVVLTDESSPVGTTLYWDWVELEDTAPVGLDSKFFNHQYNGDAVPVPNYTQNEVFDDPPSSDGDILSYRVPTNGGYFSASNWSVARSPGLTVEVRIKIGTDFPEGAAGAFALYYGDGTSGDILSIGKHFTSGRIGSQLLDSNSNTDGFHTFRVVKSHTGSNTTPIEIYRDGVLIGRFINGGDYSANVLHWGSFGSKFGGPTVQVDYVRWDNTGAYRPAMGWSTGAGDWALASNWDRALPNAVDADALFVRPGNRDQKITVNAPITVGTLRFNSLNRYLLDGSGSLSLQSSTSQAVIEALKGQQEISVPLSLASNTELVVGTVASLKLSDTVVIRSGRTLTTDGNLVITSPLTLETNTRLVNRFGNVQLRGIPSFGAGAHIDLTTQLMMVDYVDLPNPSNIVRSKIAAAFAGGTWTGQGIGSSASVPGQTGIGWKDDTTSKRIVVKYAAYGDANLDGWVNTADFNILATNFNTSNRVWATGDVNYDGRVNALDFNALATNFGAPPALPLQGVARTAPVVAPQRNSSPRADLFDGNSINTRNETGWDEDVLTY